MKVAIINCFDTYEVREKCIYNFFMERNDSVIVIKSDFLHHKKESISINKDNYIYLKTNPYKKNLSIERLMSHYRFSKDVFKLVEDKKIDLLYVLIPPNYLVKESISYVKAHSNTKLIFDIIDLWPETMPINNFKNIFPFSYWKNIRDKYLNKADFVITECDLYQQVIEKIVDKTKMETLYLYREPNMLEKTPNLDESSIHLCYLGSINNIIDISTIGEIIHKISKVYPVILKIIGDGEKKEELILVSQENGAKIEDYGKIYDPKKKQEIFNTCHYGLNIYKDTTFIGVTMKSIDYLDSGLPIINNIKGDTFSFVEKYNCGINYLRDVDEIIKCKKMIELREQTQYVVNKFFSLENGKTLLEDIIRKVC